jgi:hypothetical protein
LRQFNAGASHDLIWPRQRNGPGRNAAPSRIIAVRQELDVQRRVMNPPLCRLGGLLLRALYGFRCLWLAAQSHLLGEC